MNTIKKLLTILLSVSMLFSMVACGGGSSGDPTAAQNGTAAGTPAPVAANADPVYGGVLKYATSNTCASPAYTPKCSGNATIPYLIPAYETLVTYNGSGEVIPVLATTWETDSEEPSVTWHLREGVQFCDGTPFNAEAVIRNIEEYKASSRTETANVASVEAIDELTVKTILSNWDSSAIESIGMFVYYMSPKALDSMSVDEIAASKSSYGTGPFVISSFEANVKTSYVKNENYWQKGRPYLDGVDIICISEASTLNASLKSGDVDIIYMSTHSGAMDLINTSAAQFNSGDFVEASNESGWLNVFNGICPNSADPASPWANQKVRQALCYAINTDAVNAACYEGKQLSTNQWAYPGTPVYNENLNGFTFNPDKAKALLAEAGYPNGFDTTLTCIQSFSSACTAVAAMLDNVGIHTEVVVVDTATLMGYMQNGNWDGLIQHSGSLGEDLGLYMGRHLNYNGSFYTKGIDHPKAAMDLLDKINKAKTDEEKAKLQDEMQVCLYDADNGLALFGIPVTITKIRFFKRGYVVGDSAASSNPYYIDMVNIWLNK